LYTIPAVQFHVKQILSAPFMTFEKKLRGDKSART